ncbi:EmrB/QacA subfamily drug resistance transporter [Antricoccus suffuscus]|uniref:EmrB/QacA subfamily drug resistance transporter n=2 Tax=Antricoccus suffuscus TaxID=1629062 RepID=A0A2T1A3L7_9ACTN|nr:EmrB/QacA subfamily drug resistance transporter [Antricoccus suffuscus]
MLSSPNARWWAMAATAMSLLVVGLDMTVLNVALPDIAVVLHATNSDLQWFADAYLLVLGALLLPAGMLGDRYGRKRLTLGALVVFGAGSLWCAYAGSPAALIAARTLLGVGAAVLIPLAMSSVVVLFEPEERQKAIMVLGASTMIGLPLGPIVAGALLQHFWWGSVFLINVPVVLLALIAVWLFLPESTSGEGSRRFDLAGIGLSSAGLLGFTFGMIEGPARGWSDGVVVGSLIIGIALLVAFFVWERRVQGVEPVFDARLWSDRSFRWGSIGATVASLAFFGLMFVVPQYLRAVLGADALGTGLRTLPMVAGLIAGMRGSMKLTDRFGGRIVGAAGFAVTAVGLFLGTTTRLGDGYLLTAIWTAIVGIGFGAALFSAQNAALQTLPKARAGAGSALIQTLRQVGSVIGIAGLGAVLNGVYRSHVQVAGLPATAAHAVRDNVASGVAAGQGIGSSALVDSVRSAFVSGMSATLWISCGVAILGAVLTLLFLPDGKDRTIDNGGGAQAPGPDVAQSIDASDTREAHPAAG